MKNNKSRTRNSIRNIIFGISGQMFCIILSFVCRTVFINMLGVEYLGVSGLFSNILSMLSLAELGIGSAITYSMYKPLAENDEKKIIALMDLYAVAYRVIGCTVAVIGVSLVPLLDDFIKDKPDLPNLSIIYLMYLFDSVVSYFFAHKSAIIIADQNQYITATYNYSFTLVQNIIQIVILIVSKSFLFYLAVQIFCKFLNNFFISRHADKIYPFLKKGKKEQLDKESKKGIAKNIGAMMLHNIGTFVVCSTDNILIAMFAGIYWVGLYSNYSMIIVIINSFLGIVFSSLTASVGNLNSKESSDKSFNVFNTTFFINYWLYSFCAISLWILFNPFISMWIGSQYVMDPYIVLIIVINFFVTGMRQTVVTYKNTMGLFWNDRHKPLAESVINLVTSFTLVREIGITGVFLGTLISTITTCFWVEPYVLYKHGFKKPVTIHFAKYAVYSAIVIATALITEEACSVFTTYTFLSVMGRMVLCLVIPNTIFIVLFIRTDEFAHVYGIARGLTSSG